METHIGESGNGPESTCVDVANDAKRPEPIAIYYCWLCPKARERGMGVCPECGQSVYYPSSGGGASTW